MEKKGIIALALLCALYGNSSAQKDSAKVYVHKGMLSATLTYSVGYMSSYAIYNVYVTGYMEYYTGSKISVRGDVYYFINSLNDSKFLKQNHRLYFGACYNFQVHSHLDPFIGFQPGIAYTQTESWYGVTDPATFSPLASAVTGLNYYAERWFHILLNVRYAVGKHLDDVALFNLNEVSFSFGLGFNIDVQKRKS